MHHWKWELLKYDNFGTLLKFPTPEKVKADRAFLMKKLAQLFEAKKAERKKVEHAEEVVKTKLPSKVF